MTPIDMTTWSRRPMFDHYSTLNHPFFSVTLRLDVTPLCRWTKAHHLSFYHAFVWLCAAAVNAIPDFRYVLREGQLYELPERLPAFTDMPPESEAFHVVTLPVGEDCADFCRRAKDANAAQDFFIDSTIPPDTVVHCSCLPWVEMTGLSSARHLDPEDTAPWLTWGKFVTEGDRKIIGLCVELNHRVNDGFHVGQLQRKLTELMEAL